MAAQTSTKRGKLYRVVACPADGAVHVARYDHFRCCGRQFVTANHLVDKLPAGRSGAPPAAAGDSAPASPDPAPEPQATERPHLEFEW